MRKSCLWGQGGFAALMLMKMDALSHSCFILHTPPFSACAINLLPGNSLALSAGCKLLEGNSALPTAELYPGNSSTPPLPGRPLETQTPCQLLTHPEVHVPAAVSFHSRKSSLHSKDPCSLNRKDRGGGGSRAERAG